MLCARCVDPVTLPLQGDFDLIFRPEKADADSAERAITLDETEIGYYEESGLVLEDVVREQVLTLPAWTARSARPDCKGLCPTLWPEPEPAQSCDCEKRPRPIHDGML